MNTTLAEKFQHSFPKAYFLNPDNIREMEGYLKNKDWMLPDETIKSVSKAGEGNMNLTLRVDTGKRTFVIKQARPWVEKYPHVEAPIERNIIEGRFYEMIQNDELLLASVPAIFGKDESSFLFMMSDLGNTNDMTDLYKKDIFIEEGDVKTLARFLTVLHGTFHGATTTERIENRAMRQLNHQHLFVYPFEENDFNLDTVQKGLQQLSLKYKADEAFKTKVWELGEIYLSDGNHLLHGDYFPGSWLRTISGIKIIDPEFCFFGYPEFDLAVFIAHLKMAQQPEASVALIISEYHGKDRLDMNLLINFTGVEIMRRILGLAQLPLKMKLNERQELLEEAYQLIMNPDFS